MTIRFGIIGCGMIAGFHAKALDAVKGAKLFGCASRSFDSAKAFGLQNACEAFRSPESLFTSPGIDAVTICSPSGAHMELAIAAANSGKHVVIEKPLEITGERCDRIIEACETNNVILSTVFQSRFHRSTLALKEAVESNRFGTLSLANAYVKWFRTQEYYDSGEWRGTWELDGGGALMNQAIHNVDLLQWMMGPVIEVSAFTSTLTHDRIEVEDTAVALLKFENGALGTIEATTSAFPGSLKRLEIYGDKGSVVVEDENIQKWEFAQELDQDETIRASLSAQNETSGGASDPSAIDFSGHRKQFQNIVDAINGTTKLAIDGKEARKSVAIIEAIYQSAKSRTSVILRQ